MSTTAEAPVVVADAGRRRAGMTHFALAAGLLLVAAIGWNAVLSWKGVIFAKKPVAPPEGVRVEKHALKSFPQTLPPPESGLPAAYVLAGDGELSRDQKDKSKAAFDGKPDGLLEARDEELDTLGTLGNDLNWYYMSIYRDVRGDPRRPRYVRLDVTYYTGLLEAVPHVPERCIVAGGGTILYGLSGAVPVNLTGLPNGWQEWNAAEMYRTAFEVTQDSGAVTQGAQYHLFSVNGRPTPHWEQVRWDMGALTLKYAYFAKIQVAPWHMEGSLEASDQACRDFLKAALPSILKNLPTADDVKKLEAGDR